MRPVVADEEYIRVKKSADAPSTNVGRPTDGGVTMPIQWSIDTTAGLVRMTHTGPTEFPAWERAMTAIVASPDFRPEFGFLVNMDTSDPPTAEHQRAVVHFLETHAADLAGARWAYLAETPAHYGMARMAQLMADPMTLPIAVFRTLADAADWLLMTAGG